MCDWWWSFFLCVFINFRVAFEIVTGFSFYLLTSGWWVVSGVYYSPVVVCAHDAVELLIN